ncbi:MAG: hypothetical protein IPP51_11035 [Bacteroidetes bacterium]|nr:hypothetical protein [Bacteroidota bacterium]
MKFLLSLMRVNCLCFSALKVTPNRSRLFNSYFRTLVIVSVFLLLSGGKSYGQNLNDFRSITTGSWFDIGSWEMFDGADWVAADHTPTYLDETITISSGHTITCAAEVIQLDQVVVISGAELIFLNSSVDLSAANAIECSGTVTFNGAVTDLSFSGTVLLVQPGALCKLEGEDIFNGVGDILILSGAELQINGTDPKHFQNATVTNAGTANWNDIGAIGISPSTLFVNEGSFNVFANGEINSDGPTESVHAFVNAVSGSFSMMGGGTTTFNNISFSNNGNMYVVVGDITANSTASSCVSNGQITVQPGTTFHSSIAVDFSGTITNDGFFENLATNGEGVGTINGTGQIGFLDVNFADVVLGGNQTILSSLNLSGHTLSTGLFRLIIDENALMQGADINTWTTGSGGYVYGTVERIFSPTNGAFTYYIGDATSFAPLTLTPVVFSTGGISARQQPVIMPKLEAQE